VRDRDAESPTDRVRLDVWLDVACLFRTRSDAQRACHGGKVDVNGLRAKPHREVKAGDAIVISRPPGRVQRVVVRALAEKHIPKAEARQLYEDVTPPPTPEEQRVIDLLRLARPGLPEPSAARWDQARRARRLAHERRHKNRS
jgi:ribosome-associated heat shock protein Hsp15